MDKATFQKAMATIMKNHEKRKRVEAAGTPPEMQDFVFSGKEKPEADAARARSELDAQAAQQEQQAGPALDKVMAMQDQMQREKALAEKKKRVQTAGK